MVGGADAADRVRHVTLVVGRVQVEPVPAARSLVADVDLAAARAVHRQVDVVEAVPALPPGDEAGVGGELGGGRRRAADDELQTRRERPHAGVVVHRALVVDGLQADGVHRGGAVVHGRHPVAGLVTGREAGGAARLERGQRGGGVGDRAAHEGVHVRGAGLAGVDDRVVRQVVGRRAVRLELVEVRVRRVGRGRRHAGDLRVRQDVPGGRGADLAEDLELVQRVAVLGRPGRGVHPDVAAAAADGEVLDAAGAGGGGVDRRPVGAVRRGLELVGAGVRRLPVQLDPADRGGGAEVDPDPGRVGPGAGPAAVGVTVDDGAGREVQALDGRGRHRAGRRDQRVGCRDGLLAGAAEPGDGQDGGEGHRQGRAARSATGRSAAGQETGSHRTSRSNGWVGALGAGGRGDVPGPEGVWIRRSRRAGEGPRRRRRTRRASRRRRSPAG